MSDEVKISLDPWERDAIAKLAAGKIVMCQVSGDMSEVKKWSKILDKMIADDEDEYEDEEEE